MKGDKQMGYRNIYIYLDDEREPFWKIIPDEASVIVCRSYKAAVAALKQLVIKVGLILFLI